jgi:hypothetical protein
MVENGRQRLTSWKEIAAYLGRDVRTVLRWEKQRGLPVHRVPGATGRVVFAYRDELDAWVRGGTDPTVEADAAIVPPLVPNSGSLAQPPPSRLTSRWRSMTLAAAAVVILAGGAVWLMSVARADTGEIAQAVVTETAVHATRPDGSLQWTYPLGRLVTPHASETVVSDLNGDGQDDVVISLGESSNAQYQGALLALDHRGRKLWEYQPRDALSFGKEPFGMPWVPDDLATFTSGGQPFVAWALHHHTWWPSIVAVFNAKGDRTSTFVHSGWIRNIQLSRDGKYLLAGGISNARNGAAFAILDPAQPGGSSPENAGTRYECRNCPSGAPIRYFVIPWTDVIEPTILGGRRGQFTSFPDGGIELRAVQNQNAEMIVELTPALEIKRRHVSDGYWAVHAQLERDGLLKHPKAACPFRNGPTVHEWMPEQGWRELRP